MLHVILRIILSVMSIVMGIASALASEPGSSSQALGPTYEIKEEDFLKFIEKRLREMEKSGRLERLRKEAIKRVTNSIEHPPAVSGITTAKKARTFYFDPTIVLAEPLYDHKGQIMYPAGTTVNPFDYVNLSNNLIFIDGRDEAQVEFALEVMKYYQDRAKIVLTAGSYMELMRKNKVWFYYDQRGFLTSKWGITAVPAVVSQQGRVLRIDEIAL